MLDDQPGDISKYMVCFMSLFRICLMNLEEQDHMIEQVIGTLRFRHYLPLIYLPGGHSSWVRGAEPRIRMRHPWSIFRAFRLRHAS